MNFALSASGSFAHTSKPHRWPWWFHETVATPFPHPPWAMEMCNSLHQNVVANGIWFLGLLGLPVIIYHYEFVLLACLYVLFQKYDYFIDYAQYK